MSFNNFVELAPSGSVGTGRKSASLGGAATTRVGIEFEVEAVGATPTVTFTVQGSYDGVNWSDMQYVRLDSSVAASKAGVVRTAVGKEHLFVDGLDKRFVRFVAVNVTANTNVTFSARAQVESV